MRLQRGRVCDSLNGCRPYRLRVSDLGQSNPLRAHEDNQAEQSDYA